MLHRLDQNLSEGLSGDEHEIELADIRGHLRASRRSFKDIAADAGLSPVTVSNIASGATKEPRNRTIKNILKVLSLRRIIVATDTSIPAGVEVSVPAYWPEDMSARRAERRAKYSGKKKRQKSQKKSRR